MRTMTCSKLDRIYRSVLLSRFFIKGWGTPANLKRFRKILSSRDACRTIIPSTWPISITKEYTSSDHQILEGNFPSPAAEHLGEAMPSEITTAHFQLVLPLKWTNHLKPVCIQLAGTGDHYFWRRRNLMAKPLIREAGIGSLILENPFYGQRKPKDQVGSSLHNVSDIFIMGACLIMECQVLLQWLEKEGYGPLGLSGFSMGGHMASLAATNWPKPLVLVPCLSWSTASSVFTSGVLSNSINWQLLQTQFYSDEEYYKEICEMLEIKPADAEAFKAGQEFAKGFPHSLNQIKKLDKLDQSALVTDCNSKELSSSESFPFDMRVAPFLSTSLAFKKSSISRRITMNKAARSDREALGFMQGIMDECTHLKNFSVPVDTSLIIVVAAKADGYIPQEGVTSLRDLWPGVEVRYVDSGHIAAFLFSRKLFRDSIIEAFERVIIKYYS